MNSSHTVPSLLLFDDLFISFLQSHWATASRATDLLDRHPRKAGHPILHELTELFFAVPFQRMHTIIVECFEIITSLLLTLKLTLVSQVIC